MIQAFTKIFHVGDRYIPHLFSNDVEITEKIDGSQFVFGKTKEGELEYRSKHKIINYCDKTDMFRLAVDYAEFIAHKILPETYIYCEYLRKPRHNQIAYSRTPKNNLYLFGVLTPNGFVQKVETLNMFAEDLDIDPPNVLYYGIANCMEDINHLLTQESYLGGSQIEGIVIKNYNQPAIISERVIFPITCAKYVNEKFREKQTGWAKEHTTKGKLQSFIESFRAEPRWHKAIQHLTEQGLLMGEPKDIGKLIPEIQQDILAEHTEEIKDWLFKLYIKDILRCSTRGFPEFYKEQLLKNQFEKGE